MATAIDDAAGDPGGSRGRRRRRRERAARAAASNPTLGASAATLQPATADVALVAVLSKPSRPRRRREPVAAAPLAAPPEIPEAPTNGHEPALGPAVVVPPTEAPAADEFKDLLGQAVGLRLDSVTREFGRGDEMHVTAVRDVSIDIGPCEFVSIVGPSGCGKTTLLSLMGGLDKPTSGHVYAAGLPLDQLSDGDLADYRLQRVSTIFQTFNLIASMTVEDNVALPLTLAGVEIEERRRRANHLLKLVGLEGRARTRASRLSGGEQQKVAVARALANRPGLILADEPTGSLDSAAGENILKLLEDLNRRGATIVLVTHDPEVARHAHRVVRMIDGRAIELDPGNRTVRNMDPVTPPTRLHWRDTVRAGFGSSGRRPLRTSLTTTGVAIGIAAMSLIVALAGGLQAALASPAVARSQLHQVAVYPVGDSGTGAFSAATLPTLSNLPHVRAAWGQIGMSGTFTVPPAAGSAASAPPVGTAPGALVSLPPMNQISPGLNVTTGRLPGSDFAPEVVLTDRTAMTLGFPNAAAAIGHVVNFDASSGSLGIAGAASNPTTKHVVLPLTVVGAISSQLMPAGAPGGLTSYGLAGNYWTRLAQANNWKVGEYANITLLADSGTAVDGLHDSVVALGFQAQTFGDQFRGFEDLLGRLRLALLGLAIVALLLACLGIANTMYTAVLERTKEIGVLKALGARSRDVLVIFVAEAAVIGLAGGLVGILIAVGLARVGNEAVNRLAQGAAGMGIDVFRTDIGIALAALLIAIVLSTVSGVLPALRAARQDPSRALRYE